MKTIDLTLSGSDEPITILVHNIKTIKDQEYNYGENYTIITFLDDKNINIKENIDVVKRMINNLK
ncbi:hypothetical protein ES692_17605 [Psychroserpens burtonensis]|uniref:Uncharacterized protein n=1 Tax=Psychroserpens burtonensis TaxID=49278 RepID=A0A5C7B4V2_9FLAO|nr:hypothetical protein [Psychroserpens burtonensis]TXE14913.1 hypothetical protein ES692_17605 [Psychroserpens burtonensis]